MGLLKVGQPLSWEDAAEYREYVRDHGLEQFLITWDRVKNVFGDQLLYGDEVEYHIVKFDHENRTVKLSLRAPEILKSLQDLEEQTLQRAEGVTWHPEYGRWMVEATPREPYTGYCADLGRVERNLRLRRRRLLYALAADEAALSLPAFPRMGVVGEEEEEEEEPHSACAAIPAAAAADDDGCEEMSMREILEGKDCYFPGLIPLCQAYLDHIGCDRDTRGKVERYLDLIRARGRGELPTAAAWARAFVARHPEYARDSVVGEGVAYDLLRRCRDVAEGRAAAPELLGAAEVKPIYPEGAFEIPLSAARIDRGERCVLIQRYLHRAQERQRRATLEVDELLKTSSPRAAAAAQGHTEMAAAVAAAAAPSPDDAGGVAGPHRCGCCGEEAGCCGCPVAEEEAVPPAVALARMRSISLAATESLMGHDLFPVAPPAASSDSPSLLPVQPPPGDGRSV